MNDKITVRAAIASDFVEVDQIMIDDAVFHVELEPEWMSDTSGIEKSEFEAYIKSRDDTALVAVKGERIAGVIFIKLGIGGDAGMLYKPYYWIDEIAVKAELRNQGIGTVLMQAAENWLREEGAKSIMLDVWQKNHRAKKLYSDFGFVVFRERMFKKL